MKRIGVLLVVFIAGLGMLASTGCTSTFGVHDTPDMAFYKEGGILGIGGQWMGVDNYGNVLPLQPDEVELLKSIPADKKDAYIKGQQSDHFLPNQKGVKAPEAIQRE